MPNPAAAPPTLDPVDVARLRFEVDVFLTEIAQRAADVLEAVGMVRAKLAQLEAASEGREGQGARTATLVGPTTAAGDTE